jgi:hypothetical protein
MLEHPEITNALNTGYPYGEPESPRCPVCGSECETVYKKDFEIIGCDNCIRARDAWETKECF